ncbi:MAG: serine hydrolase domain-containing protein [Pseudomonadota bacterium]
MIRIGCLVFVMMAGAFVAPVPLRAQGNADLLQSYVSSYIRQAGLPGAVIGISYPDGGMRLASGGLAKAVPKQPMRDDHLFYIGSLTKMMTAVVILQLAAEGWLDLSDPVAKWLPPDVGPRIANGHSATIRDLLRNASGIPDYLDGDFFFELVGGDPQHGWRNAELLPLIMDRDPHFRAGTRYANSNSNYILLGVILEHIEQDDIEQIFAKRIFEPLAMRDTSFGIFPRPARLARGYDDGNGDGQLEDVSEFDVGDRLADGGVVSTAADMLRFARGLFADGKLLGPNALKRMAEDTLLAGDGSYGYGLMTGESDWGPVWGHDGVYFGYSAEFSWFPDQKTAIVFLSNGRALNDVPRATQQLLPGLFGAPPL